MMIKLLVMDVDGTLTDGKIYIGPKGEEMKAFCVKDGYAIGTILPKMGVVPVIITGRESEIVKRRCEELSIAHLRQGVRNKKAILLEIAKGFEIVPNDKGVLLGIAYVGDDEPDYECMKMAELSGCPADASEHVKEIADFISEKKGGEGAVRGFIEWICENEGYSWKNC